MNTILCVGHWRSALAVIGQATRYWCGSAQRRVGQEGIAWDAGTAVSGAIGINIIRFCLRVASRHCLAASGTAVGHGNTSLVGYPPQLTV